MFCLQCLGCVGIKFSPEGSCSKTTNSSNILLPKRHKKEIFSQFSLSKKIFEFMPTQISTCRLNPSFDHLFFSNSCRKIILRELSFVLAPRIKTHICTYGQVVIHVYLATSSGIDSRPLFQTYIKHTMVKLQLTLIIKR